MALTRCSVRPEILWEGIFELKRDAAAHYADAIDGIHQRLYVFSKNVALFVFDHKDVCGF